MAGNALASHRVLVSILTLLFFLFLLPWNNLFQVVLWLFLLIIKTEIVILKIQHFVSVFDNIAVFAFGFVFWCFQNFLKLFVLCRHATLRRHPSFIWVFRFLENYNFSWLKLGIKIFYFLVILLWKVVKLGNAVIFTVISPKFNFLVRPLWTIIFDWIEFKLSLHSNVFRKDEQLAMILFSHFNFFGHILKLIFIAKKAAANLNLAELFWENQLLK